MTTMDTRTATRPADTFRYEPEDLQPSDDTDEQAELEAYLERNQDALAASIEQARVELERSEYYTLDQVVADVDAQRQRRRAGKAKT
jgi:hypothetical protein